MSTLGGPLTYQGVEGDVKRSVCPMFRLLSLFRSLSRKKKKKERKKETVR
jgi:hypothetical protein